MHRKNKPATGTGIKEAMEAAQADGRTDLHGQPLDLGGKLAMLAAARSGETPARMRAASRAARRR